MIQNRLLSSWFVLALLCGHSNEQNVSIGATAGTNLTNDFRSIQFPATFYGSTSARSDSRSFILGPTFELALPVHFSVEIAALHRSLTFTDFALKTKVADFSATT